MAFDNAQVIKALQSKGISGACPRCGSANWELAEGFIALSLSDEPQNVTLGGQVIPTVAMICGKCGFVSTHAAGALGLM